MNLRDRVFKTTRMYPAIFAALTLLVIAVYQVMNLKTIERENRKKAASVITIYRDSKSNARSYAEMLASYGDVQRGAATDKRYMVTRITTPIFDNIKVSFLTVHDFDGYVLAKGHDPDRFGNNEKKLPHVAAALGGNRTDRLAEAEGAIALLSSVPIVYNEKTAGVVTVGYFLNDEFAARLSTLVGADILLSRGGKVIASSFAARAGNQTAAAAKSKKFTKAFSPPGRKSGGKSAPVENNRNLEKRVKVKTFVFPEMETSRKKLFIKGRRYDLSYVPIPEAGIDTGIFIATDNTVVRRILWGMIFCCTALIVAVFSFMTRRLGRFSDDLTIPIMHAAKLADRVSHGDLDVEPLDVKSTDETGRLMESFNLMVGNLREMHRKEKDQREYLESQVKRLLTVIDAAAQGDFSARFDVNRDDEFGRIGRALNKMIEDLDSLIAADTARRKYLETKISELLEIIGAASQGDFSRYYQGDQDDEIGRLGVALSEMIVDLQSMIEHNNTRRRGLESQVAELLVVIEAASRGDFSKKFAASRDDQIGRVGKALNKMLADVNSMINEIEDMKRKDRDRSEWLEGQVREILRVVEIASRGDLTVTLKVDGKEGIIADLKDNLNRMFDRLQLIVAKVRESAGDVQRTSREISGITEKLRNGAAGQAAAVEKTAVFGDNTAEAMDTVAKATEDVLRLSRETNAGAAAGGETIGKAVSGMAQVGEAMEDIETVMADLETSAEEIDEILKAIDEISDQTNLLALNAAIEAARAGEYGRGFSVVAKEISSLAHKSVESTREITQIVRRIQERVKKATASTDRGRQRVSEGVSLADQAGRALDNIVASVDHVTSLIQDTAEAIEHRRDDTSQIRRLLKEILDISEESSSLAARTSEAVEALSRLSSELDQFVGQIKIRSDSARKP